MWLTQKHDHQQDPLDKAVCPWYEGRTLLQQLDKLKITGRDPDAMVRMPVLDKYSDRGVVIMGKLEAGTLLPGDTLMVQPTKQEFKVEKILINDEEVSPPCGSRKLCLSHTMVMACSHATLFPSRQVNSAVVGENVKLKIKGLNEDAFLKG